MRSFIANNTEHYSSRQQTDSSITQWFRRKILKDKLGRLSIMESKRHEKTRLLRIFLQCESLHNAWLCQCTLRYCFWLLIKEITSGQYIHTARHRNMKENDRRYSITQRWMKKALMQQLQSCRDQFFLHHWPFCLMMSAIKGTCDWSNH